MSEESKAIESAVSEFLTANGFTYSATYVGQVKKENNWDADEWRVTIVKGTGEATGIPGKEMVLPYFTGLGLRAVPVRDAEWLKRELAIQHWGNHANITARYSKPVTPAAAGVLHSIISEAEAINESFTDWCDNYGYDSDSIKALNTYNECCATGKQIRAMFTREQVEALRELVQDY